MSDIMAKEAVRRGGKGKAAAGGQRVALPAKLIAPSTRQVLARERLFATLDELRSDHKVVWICAPAGSGKTMLLASYLAQRKLGGVWYRLEPGDSDVSTFFHYLNLGAHHATARKKGALPQYNDNAGAAPLRFAEHYFARLHERLRPQQTVVLDDYHLVDNEPLFNELIVALAQSLPPGRCLLIGSRREPPRQFSRLLVNQKVAVVREETLHFNQEETGRFLGAGGGAQRLAQVQRLTEGWAAGVVLLARQQGLTAEGPRQTGVLFDYFAHELFSRFEPSRQQLLLTTCFLEEIHPEQAAALSGEAGAAAQLRALVVENLFTQAIGQHHYRYHTLFRHFLQSEARQRFDGAALARLRRHSAALLEQGGYFEEAVALYGEEGEWDEAVRVCIGAAPQLFGAGRSRSLAAIIERLPAPLVEQDPWLLHWRGVVRLASYADGALTDLAAAFDGFIAAGLREAACWSWVAAVQFQTYQWRSANDLLDWLERRYALLQLGPDEPADFGLRFRLTALMALAHYQTQHHTEANAGWLARLEQMIEACTDAPLREEGMVAAYFIYFVTGECSKLRRLIERSNPEVVSYEQSPLLYMMLMINTPMSLIFMGRFEESQKYIARAERVVEEYGITSLLDTVLTVKSYIAIIGGDDETALQALARMKGLTQGNEYARLNYTNLSAYYYREHGKHEQACHFIEQAVAITEAMNYRGYGIYNRVDQLQSLMESGEEGRYLERYPAVLADVEQCGYHPKRVQLRQVEAERLRRLGDRQGWFRLLEEALQIAAATRLCLFPGWSRRYFSGMLLFALQHDICRDYATTYVEEHRELLDPPAPYELQWSWPVRIRTLGGFALEEATAGRERLEGKSLALLKLLVMHGRLGREALLEALYPEQPEARALNAYYVCLHRLRKALGGEQSVLTSGQGAELNPRWCWIDAAAIEAVSRAEGEGAAARRARLIPLYRGEYLPGEEDDSVLTRREGLRGTFIRLVLDELNALGADAPAAIALSLQALEAEPAAEVLYQQLIRLYLSTQRRDLAQATFEQCRRVLRSQLDIEPASYTCQLLDA
jgi:LuxR family maltose regulon positive regulatory protein